MIKVLVVDDEPQILRALRINLRARGYDVEVAACGAEALRVAATQQPELVVLDLGLPDLDGIDVIHGLRGWTAVPIIVLSGRSGSSDKVAALDAGADFVGINNRDLDTFVTTLETTARLRALVPAGAVVVSESGISTRADLVLHAGLRCAIEDRFEKQPIAAADVEAGIAAVAEVARQLVAGQA